VKRYQKVKPVTRAQVDDAATALGLTFDDLTIAQVQAAFRRVARQIHPDMCAVKEPAEQLSAAFKNRDLLLRWLSEQPDADCPLCNGSGHIRVGRFGSQPCPHCAE